MNKEQKEKWIVEQFLESYNKDSQNPILYPKQVPTTVASGPDFIAQYKNDGGVGIEVTELLDYPSKVTGQQRYLESHFIKFLNEKLDAVKFKGYSFALYDTVYPESLELLEKHACRVITKINSLNLTDVKKRRKQSFYINNQKFTISFYQKQSTNTFVSFIYGENGVQESHRNNWFIALKTILQEKEQKASGYLNTQPNMLVIYDNSDYGIFLNDVKTETRTNIERIVSNKFIKIWLLKGNLIFEL